MSHDTHLPTDIVPAESLKCGAVDRIAQAEFAFGDPLLMLVRLHAQQFRPEFAAWLAANQHVWMAFSREADRIWNRGRRRYSARTIAEYLRHESAVRDATDAEFKWNDHNTPDLARLYLLVHPGRAGFFETRVPANSERAA